MMVKPLLARIRSGNLALNFVLSCTIFCLFWVKLLEYAIAIWSDGEEGHLSQER